MYSYPNAEVWNEIFLVLLRNFWCKGKSAYS